MNGQDAFAQNPNSKVRVKVIKSLCIGAATCVITAPETFDLDKDGIAYVKEGAWDELADVIAGAKSCPTIAIVIEDLNGKQIWPATTEVKSA